MNIELTPLEKQLIIDLKAAVGLSDEEAIHSVLQRRSSEQQTQYQQPFAKNQLAHAQSHSQSHSHSLVQNMLPVSETQPKIQTKYWVSGSGEQLERFKLENGELFKLMWKSVKTESSCNAFENFDVNSETPIFRVLDDQNNEMVNEQVQVQILVWCSLEEGHTIIDTPKQVVGDDT